mgnify:CR=1 FL=1|jgi:hypothetical protein
MKRKWANNENIKHIRFIIIFSIVYIAVKYGYPLLKQLIF